MSRNEYNENGYSINNPDGVNRRGFGENKIVYHNEGKILFSNDKKQFVTETRRVNEWSEDTRRRGGSTARRRESSDGGDGSAPIKKNPVSSASEAVQKVLGRDAAVTATTSHAAALTVAGVASAAVTTAVVVVAYVATALSLSVSLFAATFHSLTFFLDFENVDRALVLVLEGGDEIYSRDYDGEKYVTFEELSENKEYYFSVLDKETSEVRYSASFFTTRYADPKATVEASFPSDGKFTIALQANNLLWNDFYTLSLSDADGYEFFVMDGNEPTLEKTFDLASKTVFVSLKINNDVVFFEKYVLETESDIFDFLNAVFEWNEGYTEATVTVPAFDPSVEPMLLVATVESAVLNATCESDGSATYTATAVSPEGRELSDVKNIVLTAIGHAYGEPTFEWTDLNDNNGGAATAATVMEQDAGDETTPNYSVVAVFVCQNDPTHVERVAATVSTSVASATCEEDGAVVWTASVTFGCEDYQDQRQLVLTAIGHAYTDPTFAWTPIYGGDDPGTPVGYTATATFTCANDGEHTLVLDAEVTHVDTPATCEEDGYRVYTATVTYENEEYADETMQQFEGTATGHDYSQYYEGSDAQPTFTWTEQPDGSYTATVTFACNNDPEHTQTFDAEVSAEDGSDCENGGTIYYYANFVFNDYDYQDEKEVEVAPGHHYVPVFHWMMQESTYEVEFYLICKKEDDAIGPITAEVTITEQTGYVLYTATATHDDVEYTDTKKVETVETTKALAQNVNYYLGDTIELGEDTVYFSDDYDGAHRTNLSSIVPLTSVLRAGESPSTSTYNTLDILDYDRILLDNQIFARMNDGDIGDVNSAMYDEQSWMFTASNDPLIGVTITSGSGVKEDPYVLTPLYGVTVTYNANDGIFNVTTEDTVVKRYYTAQEISDGVYAVPPAENPEASGRLFLGWFTDEYGENKFDFENTPITGDVTLYAGWIGGI